MKNRLTLGQADSLRAYAGVPLVDYQHYQRHNNSEHLFLARNAAVAAAQQGEPRLLRATTGLQMSAPVIPAAVASVISRRPNPKRACALSCFV
jgi:hypothetical protein